MCNEKSGIYVLMIIHKYILRITKDKGAIDASEHEFCCTEIMNAINNNSYRATINGFVSHDGTQYTKCPKCETSITYKKHYVGMETLLKHISKEYKGEMYV